MIGALQSQVVHCKRYIDWIGEFYTYKSSIFWSPVLYSVVAQKKKILAASNMLAAPEPHLAAS